MLKFMGRACILALMMALMAVPVSAADTFPEGFSFEAESAGEKIVVENDSISNGTGQQGSSGGATTAADPAKAVDIEEYKTELVRLLNEQRVENGLSDVERCDSMDAVAAIRARELSQSLSHTRPDGTWYTTLADEAGITYKYIGENAAKNGATATPSNYITGWMNSDGHRANMLLEKHTKVGVGVYYSGQYCYVSLMLYY